MIFLLLLIGCAGGDQRREVVLEHIRGDLFIRDIGSDSAMPVPGGTTIAAKADFPVNMIPVNGVFDYERTGLFSGSNVKIKDVSGTVLIERAMVGEMNIDLPASLEKLFKPGDPFGDRYMK